MPSLCIPHGLDRTCTSMTYVHQFHITHQHTVHSCTARPAKPRNLQPQHRDLRIQRSHALLQPVQARVPNLLVKRHVSLRTSQAANYSRGRRSRAARPLFDRRLVGCVGGRLAIALRRWMFGRRACGLCLGLAIVEGKVRTREDVEPHGVDRGEGCRPCGAHVVEL